jgi:hypothetical protein
MTAVSSRNPNLCLSCEQLVEDDSAELDRLLSDTEHAVPVNRWGLGAAADEAPHGVLEYAHSVFFTPA